MATEYATIVVKRGSADDWAASPIPLASGEWGYDETNKVAKIGDGFTAWADLPAQSSGLTFDAMTGFFSAGAGNPIPSADAVTGQLPDDVRERIAANLADIATPEGAAVAGASAGIPFDTASATYKPTYGPAIPSVGEDGQFPGAVRTVQAENLTDETTPEGAAVASVAGDAASSAAGAVLTYDETTKRFTAQTGQPIPTVDPSTLRFPDPVRAANAVLTPVWFFGAKGDGSSDDTAALNAAIAAGVPLYWGGPDRSYKITGTLAATLQKPLVWHSDGAQIVVGSASSIQRAVNIDTNGHAVTIDGPLVLDCARLAFTGWYFRTTSTTRANFTARQLSVRNVFRASTALTGGDGLFISGGYENIYLERPDVRTVTMAAGAGVQGSQGVAGITIRSEGAGLAPGEISIVHPYVSGVYSEDAAYLMDQDGIRIFTEDDNGSVTLFDTHFVVLGGTIKNCHGRSLKSQAEFGSIIGTKILRDTSVVQMQGQGQMPEIDFQVGGGIVSNVEVRYQSASPLRVIQASGTRQAATTVPTGGKYSTGLKVMGMKLSVSGGSNAVITNLIAINMYEQVRMSVSISDVEFVNLGNFVTGNLIEASGPYATTGYELIVRLRSIFAPMNASTYVFYRSGSVAVPTWVSATDIANTRPQTTGTLFGSAVTGGLTSNAYGQQIRVS